MNMKQVTRNEFYKAMVSRITNDPYPYTLEFTIRHTGRVVGRIVCIIPEDRVLVENQYYLAKGK